MYDNNSVRIQDQPDFKDLCIIYVDPKKRNSMEVILNELDRCVESYEKKIKELNRK